MKIKSNKKLVILHGDEMAQVAFAQIIEKFIKEKIDINLAEFDLSAENRLKTNGDIVKQAIKSLKENNVGIKNAGITVNKKQLADLVLKLKAENIDVNANNLDPLATKSPNGAIRKAINGNILREDIPFTNLKQIIPDWQNKDIKIATTDFGGFKEGYNSVADRAGTLILKLVAVDNKETILQTRELAQGDMYLLASYNLVKIEKWARGYFNLCLAQNISAYLALKDTVMPGYDGAIKEVIDKVYLEEFATKFKDKNLEYNYGLIDAQAANMVVAPPKSALWAIPDNNVGYKMEALVKALKSKGVGTQKTSLLVSRMSAGAGDQYGSYNQKITTYGKLVLSLDDKQVYELSINDDTAILLMNNTKLSVEDWIRQTFAASVERDYQVCFGCNPNIKYEQEFAKIIKETAEKMQANHEKVPQFEIISPDLQLVKMVVLAPAKTCYASLNMDGDIYSDIAAALGGSLATSSSIIAGYNGATLFEAPHGTAPDLYKKYLASNGKEALFNPSALIYAVICSLEIIAADENNNALLTYAKNLKSALIKTVESGIITADIKGKTNNPTSEKLVDLPEFLSAVLERLN